MFDMKELHDMEAESQHIDEVMTNVLLKHQDGREIIYGKQRKQDALNNLRKKVDQLRNQDKDGKKGTIDIIYEGDWTTPVPWPIVIAGKTMKHGAVRLWLCLMYHERRKDEEKFCFPSAARLADFMGISTVQFSKYIRELKDVGLVNIQRKQRVNGLGVINVYTLVDPIKWWKKTGEKLKKARIEKKNSSYGEI